MIQEVLVDLELIIEEKNAKVIVEKLPFIKAVPHQMQQLFYNLINNSLKFSKPDEKPYTLITCIKLRHSNVPEPEDYIGVEEFYEIAVKDHGIGFDQVYGEKIFKIFQRLHTKQEFAGTGIGLALCRKVVATHSGRISAEGKLGEGATFTILLPV